MFTLAQIDGFFGDGKKNLPNNFAFGMSPPNRTLPIFDVAARIEFIFY